MELTFVGKLKVVVAAFTTVLASSAVIATTAQAATTRPASHVIVRGAANAAAAADAVHSVGGRVERVLGLIDAVAAVVPADSIATLRATRGVREVTDNAAVTLAGSVDDSYAPQNDANSLYNIESTIGARAKWRAGVTGAGVDVALVDSGVAPVPGIQASNLIQGPDLTLESQRASTNHLDTYGHGTHLAGIIGGHDAAVTDVSQAANDTGDFLGVAPDARIVSVKVADRHGNSDVSQVIAGIDWVVQHAQDDGLNIRVLNLSFGTDSTQGYVADPLAFAAEQAWKHGIVVVVSAGNSGATSGRMTDPAIDPFVVTVGADDTAGTKSVNDDTVAAFSSPGDGIRNPDVVAPGVHVQSLRVPNSDADIKHAVTGLLGTRYFRGSGTSQAAAVVSGAVALILDQAPNLTPDQVKYVLMSQALALPSASPQAQGAGLISLQGGYGAVPDVHQNFRASTGVGSLEASRGNHHVVIKTPYGDMPIRGEMDLLGRRVNTAALARLEAAGASWQGATWNSSSWASSSWASSSWASSSWASSSWADDAWASSSWADDSWASSSWS